MNGNVGLAELLLLIAILILLILHMAGMGVS